MVFNLGFDNSLWLILSCDNKYRFNIAELIYNMPKELYDSICNQLKEYNKDNVDYEIKCFRNARMDTNGLNSYYYVEVDPCKITIKLKRWNSAFNKFNEDIELVLYSLNLFELDELEYPISFGKYNYNRSQFLNPFISLLSVIGDNREYEICDNNDLLLDISLSDDMELSKKVNLKLLANEMMFDDLRDRRSVKKLVRGRK